MLASEFSKFVSNSGLNESMRYKRPTPMIAPHLAVQSIMTALQMNDYPEEDAGAHTAYLFSKPYDCENLIAGQVCNLHRQFNIASRMVHGHSFLIERLIACLEVAYQLASE